MNNVTRTLILSLLATCLFACNETHFLTDPTYRKQVVADLDTKREQLPQGDLFAPCDDPTLSCEEREAMQFLYAYMPIGDITDYSGAYYLENIRLSKQIREEMPWGKSIPENLYRHFVLPIRVNNENLDDARRIFYAELKERVKGLSLRDAILEVNHWCHEKVVYTPSDARTSSPLASVKTAYGRCGEESTFTVAALRAVGIPARQVYTPRWAHTDDNHAWVEAWADGTWYFLGACEPEPVLNLGWFNAPASRGMLMHTKVFGRYNGPEEIILETPNYTEINVVENYAPTGKGVVVVRDSTGNPLPDAQVDFKIYNYAEFFTVATKQSDAQGLASLTAGRGDLLVWASKGDRFGYGKLSFGENDTLTLTLDKRAGEEYAIPFNLAPPAENAQLPEVTTEQRAENSRRMAQEDSIRNAYVATFISPEAIEQLLERIAPDEKTLRERIAPFLPASRGNYQTLIDFLTTATTQKRLSDACDLLETLSAKDLRDVSIDVLNDHFNHSVQRSYSPPIYVNYLYAPRVSNEMLTPYKTYLQSQLPKEDAERFRNDPQTLVAWCQKEIKINHALNTQRIPISPAGVWRARVADVHSRNIFFVAMARSIGIPAHIDPVTGKVQYWKQKNHKKSEVPMDVNFDEAQQAAVATGFLQATYTPTPALKDPKYYTHFTLSKYQNGSFQLLRYNESDQDMGGGLTWSNLLKKGLTLDVGSYMLVTGIRLASGEVLATTTIFTIEAGKSKTIDLYMRTDKEKVRPIGTFQANATYLPIAATEPCSIMQSSSNGAFVVALLGVGEEPTNHALRDIAARKDEFEKWGGKLLLLFPNETQYKKFKPADFPGLPSTVIFGIDQQGKIQQQIAQAMRLSRATTLPLVILADTEEHIFFLSQGYTIGLGEQLIKVIHQL